MADPVTVLTAGTILVTRGFASASLAFQEFVKSGAGELAKRFTGEVIHYVIALLHAKIGRLRELIWNKLKGNPDAEEALEKVQTSSEEEISDTRCSSF